MDNNDILLLNTQTATPNEKIEQLALNTLNLTINNKNIPVDVVAIAQKMGFSVYSALFKDKEDVSGMVIDSPNEKIIYVNKNESPERQRFTIGHEIGHIVLHHTESDDFTWIDYRKNTRTEFVPIESEANKFSSALLMPEDKVIKFWNNYNSIEKIAEYFFVSEVAMRIRLEKLGLLSV